MRKIIVSDVHGCLDELEDLLFATDFKRSRDELVFVGDLTDRGPDPLGCVRKAQELGAKCVMGNHESKHVRYRKHENKKKADPAYKNPMRPFGEQRLKEHFSFTDADMDWMEKLPKLLRVDEKLLVVHAGLAPNIPVERQPEQILMMGRFLDEKDKMIPLTADHKDPPNGVYWTKRWGGPESVVYGHQVWDYENPRVEENVPGVEIFGIDTGCVFGGYLTALIWPEKKFVAVKAEREYYPRNPQPGQDF
jgi:bis(5'-nucleosyl)-tetraphosphatase (symmetrical)